MTEDDRTTPSALLARLEQLEALEAIRDLQSAYAAALDAKDWTAFGAVFAPDGEIVAGLGTTRGPEAIQKMFTDALRDTAPGHHVLSNIAIEIEADRATGRSYWYYVCADDAGWPQVLQFGHYEDTFVKRPEGWRIQRRVAARDLGFPPYKRST
jgi:uncharacterized protein (TIGR02246 family)